MYRDHVMQIWHRTAEISVVKFEVENLRPELFFEVYICGIHKNVYILESPAHDNVSFISPDQYYVTAIGKYKGYMTTYHKMWWGISPNLPTPFSRLYTDISFMHIRGTTHI